MRKLILFVILIVSFDSVAQYTGAPRQRKIIFEGNSLTNATNIPVALLPYGFYIPTGVYNNVRTGRVLAYTCYSIAGRTQTQINASLNTNIIPYLSHNDIIVLWEGTNDLYVNGITGQQAFDNLISYAQTVRARGAKLVVCTVIARDYSLDAADLMDRINTYNSLIRANPGEFDAICDLAANENFNERSDASNTTYYNVDKIHLATGGSDLVITLMTSTLESMLGAFVVPFWFVRRREFKGYKKAA